MITNGYSGQHSLRIGDRHTWDDWHLIPTSRPLLAVPQPKTNFIEIPGAHGSLDYTEVHSGVKYYARAGSWEFIVANDYGEWYNRKAEITNYLQGKVFQVIFTDDPRYYITCRLAVNEWRSEKDWSTIVIDYYASDPYRYPVETTTTYDWLWNELFDNTIYYGRFTLNGTKGRNLINSGDISVKIAITCSMPGVTIEREGEEDILLQSGTTLEALTLQPGDNFMVFNGYGQIQIDYSTGRIL